MTHHLHLSDEAFENLLQLTPDVEVTADATRKYAVIAGVTYSADLRAAS